MAVKKKSKRAKTPREKIRLVSTGTTEKGEGTGYFYTTAKNKRNTTEKLRRKKFDPRAWDKIKKKLGMHVEFKEDKIK